MLLYNSKHPFLLQYKHILKHQYKIIFLRVEALTYSGNYLLLNIYKSRHPLLLVLLIYGEIGIGECITIIDSNPCWKCHTEIRIAHHGTTEDLFREIA